LYFVRDKKVVGVFVRFFSCALQRAHAPDWASVLHAHNTIRDLHPRRTQLASAGAGLHRSQSLSLSLSLSLVRD
jgi:hypothetical protein